MGNGILWGVRIPHDVDTMVRDSYVTVSIVRVVAGSDANVAVFSTRIAQATSAIASRDKRPLPGDAPDLYFVMPIPDASDVKPGDSVWVGTTRYRVTSVDALPGGRQAMLEGIQ